MDFVDFFFIAAGSFSVYLGMMVALRGQKKLMYKTFAFFAVNLGFWAVSLVLLHQTEYVLFERLGLLFALLGISSLPVFVYTFPDFPKPQIWFYSIYLLIIPAIYLLLASSLLDPLSFKGGVLHPNGGPWFWMYGAIIAFYMLLALIIYLFRFFQTKGDDRLRVQYVGLGLATFILLGLLGVVILPMLGDYDYLMTAPMTAFLVFLTLTTLAVIQEELIDVRIVVTEIFVFLAAGIVLLNQLIRARGSIEVTASLFLLFIFLITAGQLTSLVVKIFRQQKQLRQANLDLQDLMNMKAEFLQIASHQLRAPLTSLYGLAKLNDEGFFATLSADQKKEVNHRILISVQRLHDLVNDLLRTLRLEDSHLSLRLVPTDVVAVIKESVETLRINYEKRGLYLNVIQPKEKLPPCYADVEYLRQVFINLIDNAEHYMKTGGATITVVKAGDSIEIQITDTGIGITPAEMKHLFQKFARADRARAMRSEGTGLGLFIVKKIIAGHGGTFKITSPGENQGSTAHIALPLHPPKQMVEPIKPVVTA